MPCALPVPQGETAKQVPFEIRPLKAADGPLPVSYPPRAKAHLRPSTASSFPNPSQRSLTFRSDSRSCDNSVLYTLPVDGSQTHRVNNTRKSCCSSQLKVTKYLKECLSSSMVGSWTGGWMIFQDIILDKNFFFFFLAFTAVLNASKRTEKLSNIVGWLCQYFDIFQAAIQFPEELKTALLVSQLESLQNPGKALEYSTSLLPIPQPLLLIAKGPFLCL